ncbi:hypothetical protein F4823DRAFT_42443 [Ustulina deusta]|nr:hypothetical protein F4823DRAFT_42443 [Ustulina deusta]
MGGSYVPPFRRRTAGDAPPAEDAPNESHQSTRHNNRAADGGQGNRGYGRRGRGGYQKDFKKQKPQVDQSDLYHQGDIHNYFWGSEHDARSSTFHDSKDHPGELSHMLLFFGANPRWAIERIVFAKSHLTLLPEYAAKKAENREWETEMNVQKGAGEAVESVEGGAIESDDAIPTQDSTTGVLDSSSSNRPGDDEADESTSGGNTNNEKREDQHATVKVEGTADHEGQATPISTPPSTKTTSHLKYTDIRKEEAQITPAPNQSTAASSRMKYTDIRLIPAAEFYDEPFRSELEPTFPAITPIDYVPANPLPIAVFEERRIPGPRTEGPYHLFAFKGWFKISRVNVLAPHSAELVRMLQQKWERKDRFGNPLKSRARDASAWNASLAQEWAVVRFELLEGEDAPSPPQIEKLPEPERPVEKENGETKSVNEMLSDMRLNDGNKDRRAAENLGEGATVKPAEECPSKGLPGVE